MRADIETQSLSKRFGTFQAVEGVSLRVGGGEVLALLGPNGAGKTTTVRMLACLLEPTSGRAWVAGHDILQEPLEVRRKIGLLTEHHGLYTRMQPMEYLLFFGRAYGMEEGQIRRRSEQLIERLELAEVRQKRLGEFSKGMRQKLALARALLHEPPVLLLDEPTSAMDPGSARLVRQAIMELRAQGRALIVCTHNLTEAERLADRIAFIRQGRIVALGTPEALRHTYLGPSLMEVRLADELNGRRPSLPRGARLVQVGGNWLRFESAQPERINPQVINALHAQGLRVVTLSERQRTLEEVYLRVMAEAPQRETAP
jgi:ABC-2 type transport system ATP-binding protein